MIEFLYQRSSMSNSSRLLHCRATRDPRRPEKYAWTRHEGCMRSALFCPPMSGARGSVEGGVRDERALLSDEVLDSAMSRSKLPASHALSAGPNRRSDLHATHSENARVRVRPPRHPF